MEMLFIKNWRQDNAGAYFWKNGTGENISVEEMRAMISDRIEKGWNDEDPVKREQWRKIPCAGEVPTPDEWLSYVIKKIKDDGQEGLLQKYLIW